MFYTEFATSSNQAFMGASASDLLLYTHSNTRKMFIGTSNTSNAIMIDADIGATHVLTDLSSVTMTTNAIHIMGGAMGGGAGVAPRLQYSTSASGSDFVITADQIPNYTITAQQIANNTITSNQIAIGGISSTSLAINSVGSNAIADRSIPGTKLVNFTIGTNQIASNSLTANQIANNAITSQQIANNTITSSQIAIGGISSAALAINSVGSNAIIDATIPATKLVVRRPTRRSSYTENNRSR